MGSLLGASSPAFGWFGLGGSIFAWVPKRTHSGGPFGFSYVPTLLTLDHNRGKNVLNSVFDCLAKEEVQDEVQ